MLERLSNSAMEFDVSVLWTSFPASGVPWKKNIMTRFWGPVWGWGNTWNILSKFVSQGLEARFFLEYCTYWTSWYATKKAWKNITRCKQAAALGCMAICSLPWPFPWWSIHLFFQTSDSTQKEIRLTTWHVWNLAHIQEYNGIFTISTGKPELWTINSRSSLDLLPQSFTLWRVSQFPSLTIGNSQASMAIGYFTQNDRPFWWPLQYQ